MQLRETQAAILDYAGGKMGVAAVPGSGKTFILTRLAAKLIKDERIRPEGGQQVLIVTYLNASVENFKSRMRDLLASEGLNQDLGYDVRTLHSLGLEILRTQYGGDAENSLIVLDGGQSSHFLELAINQWRTDHPDFWISLNPDITEAGQTRWMRKVDRMASSFIREAKNLRYRPSQIDGQLSRRLAASQENVSISIDEEALVEALGEGVESLAGPFFEEDDSLLPLLQMLNGIYAGYQALVTRQGALDYNDLIWQASDLIERNPELTDYLRKRWPYILEDEAQDSVPLQEVLLDTLSGDQGNWVRVGDPNQAITSSFTAARPRYLTEFLERDDVQARPLPHSGRCAPKVLEAANKLLRWTTEHHPVIEVRRSAFRPQMILPTPPGDAQPNPPEEEAGISIKVYSHREDEELPKVSRLSGLYMQKFEDRTVAILTPTHDLGHKIAENLDNLGIPYDNLLRGGTREREIAAALHGILAIMVNPLKSEHFRLAFLALRQLNHPAVRLIDPDGVGRFEAILRSVRYPEKFLYPHDWSEDLLTALPVGVPKPEDFEALAEFVGFVQGCFPFRLLPIDDLIISVGDELLADPRGDLNETDLAIAYQIANLMRSWGDLNPSWRLPDYVDILQEIANGRRHLDVVTPEEGGFEPKPGRVTLTTQHGSKGLEWDAVFIVGIDNSWIPGSLDGFFRGVDHQLGVDLSSEVIAGLRLLMEEEADLHPGFSPTDSGHIDVICERLRLLYVGITRAKRFLQISRSRKVRRGKTSEQDAEPTSALGVLYQHAKEIS